MRQVFLLAPAKINLLLRVMAKRADGYHDLETWMQKLELCDEIELSLTEQPGIVLEVSGLAVPGGEENLAWRAAAAFLAAYRCGHEYGIRLHLKKNIPIAAGLGGGSSDAGTVLRGLNQLFGEPLGEEELVAIARSLGADVPFFAVSHAAVLAGGIGDRMVPVEPVMDCRFVLVNPGIALSTRSIFENFALTRHDEASILARFHSSGQNTLSLEMMYNDLERVSCRKCPEIEKIKEALLNAGASRAMMSGSGPTVFGVFPDQGNCGSLAAAVERLRQNEKYRVFVVRACAGAWPSGEGTGF